MTAPIVPVIRTDTSQVQAFFTSIDQTMSKVAAVALNRTGEAAMREQRLKMLDGRFTIRAPQFDVPPANIPGPWRATPDKLYATVALFYDEGPKSIGYKAKRTFAKFQVAQTVQPTGARQLTPFFQPTPVLRTTNAMLVDRKLYPRNLVGLFDTKGNFLGLGRKQRSNWRNKRLKNPAKKINLNGLQATVFVLGQPGQDMHGIYARFGPGDNFHMIWHFMQEQKVPKRLDNYEDAMRASFAIHWPDEMARAMDALWKGAIK